MNRLHALLEEIQSMDKEICKEAQKKWDAIGKPLRSLGKLEEMVLQEN